MAAGIEPAGDFGATADGQCGCEFCRGWRAANVLHSEVASCPGVAAAGAELQRVVATWGTLPEGIRAAVIALIGAVAVGPPLPADAQTEQQETTLVAVGKSR